jgi:hypothetical protein
LGNFLFAGKLKNWRKCEGSFLRENFNRERTLKFTIFAELNVQIKKIIMKNHYFLREHLEIEKNFKTLNFPRKTLIGRKTSKIYHFCSVKFPNYR